MTLKGSTALSLEKTCGICSYLGYMTRGVIQIMEQIAEEMANLNKESRKFLVGTLSVAAKICSNRFSEHRLACEEQHSAVLSTK